MKVHYNCQALLEKAVEIRSKSQALIREKNWDKLGELLAINEEVWSGPAADSYRRLVDSLMENHNKRAYEVIAILPDTLEADVKRMQEADNNVAALIHKNLAKLHLIGG